MKLSIITVCLNDKNIERTCKSICSQNFDDFEWIIIDGKSNLETIKTIQKYKEKISKFISEKDSGIYDAMNKGILVSTGEYVSFMNAGDCFYLPDTLSNIFNKNFYQSDILYGDVEIVKNRKTVIEKNPKNITKQFFLYGTINHQACFIKKDLFLKYGLYNLRYKTASDFEKLILWEKNGCSFKYLNQIVAIHYRNGISSNKKIVKNEWRKIKKEYYSRQDKKLFNSKYQINFCGIKLLSIKDIFPKKYVNLFGLIPILKIRKNLIYLFGLNFLPILKIKENINE